MNVRYRAHEWPLVPTLWRLLLRWRFQLLQRHRYGRLVMEEVAGRSILVLPTVFNPNLFRTGRFFAESLSASLIPRRSSVLELGTGAGAVAVVAAHWARRVVAVDIHPEAVRCARINVLLNAAEDRVDVRLGDLFRPVEGERFDRILFNPPFYQGTPRHGADRAWRSLDVPQRFSEGLAKHLSPWGEALLVLSTDADEASFIENLASRAFYVEMVVERPLVNESLRIYRARSL